MMDVLPEKKPGLEYVASELQDHGTETPSSHSPSVGSSYVLFYVSGFGYPVMMFL